MQATEPRKTRLVIFRRRQVDMNVQVAAFAWGERPQQNAL
jgi:hypothetical protein